MFFRSYDDLNEMRRSLDQVFENLFATTPRHGAQGTTKEWVFTPAVESGTEEHLNLRFVVPGVSEKDVKVTVQGNQLYVQGERKAPENFGKEGYVWNQIPYGKFERVLDLPARLDLEKLKAHLHEGFLDVQIPLASAMKPKTIPISTGQADRGVRATVHLRDAGRGNSAAPFPRFTSHRVFPEQVGCTACASRWG